MTDLTRWDAIILICAALVAVSSLVRLMLARRDALVQEVKGQIAASKAKRKKRKKNE